MKGYQQTRCILPQTLHAPVDTSRIDNIITNKFLPPPLPDPELNPALPVIAHRPPGPLRSCAKPQHIIFLDPRHTTIHNSYWCRVGASGVWTRFRGKEDRGNVQILKWNPTDYETFVSSPFHLLFFLFLLCPLSSIYSTFNLLWQASKDKRHHDPGNKRDEVI